MGHIQGTMEAHNDVTADYYSYQERVLLSPPTSQQHETAPFWHVRLESHSTWSDRTWAHPFSKNLQGILEQFPEVSRILIQSSSSPSSSYPSTSHFGLDDVPTLEASNASSSKPPPPAHRGPSGVWIRVHVRGEDEEGSTSKKEDLIPALLTALADRRLAAAPVSAAKYHDVISLAPPTREDVNESTFRGEYDSTSETHNNDWAFQVMLPTDGASMSADAIQQSFSALTPCDQGMFSHSTALSNLMLGENHSTLSRITTSIPFSNSRRSLWLDLTSHTTTSSLDGGGPSRYWTSSQGIQYTLPYAKQAYDNWSQWVLPGANIQADSCPLANGPIDVQVVRPAFRAKELSTGRGYRLVPIQDAGLIDNENDLITKPSSLPWFTISKTARRPEGIANRGSLQTVVQNDANCVAQVTLRDVVPSFITPQWRTLQAYMIRHEDYVHDPNNHNKRQIVKPIVEWRTMPSTFGGDVQQDEVIRIETQLEPQASLWVSLDYDPAFLSFEEFPGDPNRGMEVTPSMATVACLNDTNDSYSLPPVDHHLFSNTVLILPPVPDMSMPFNVTSLTSSLFAYVIGTLVALLVKKSSEKVRYTLHPDEKPKSKLAQLKERIVEKVATFKVKWSTNSDSNLKNNERAVEMENVGVNNDGTVMEEDNVATNDDNPGANEDDLAVDQDESAAEEDNVVPGQDVHGAKKPDPDKRSVTFVVDDEEEEC